MLHFSLRCNAVPRVAALGESEVKACRLSPDLGRQDGLMLVELL